MSSFADPGGLMSDVRKNARWLILLGIMEIILGLLAITAPLMAGVTVTILIGIFLLVRGVARIFGSLGAGSWASGILGLLIGLLAVVVGIMFLTRPGAALAWITWLLAVYFLAVGIAGIILAFRLRKQPGWLWTLINGIVSLVLGVLIISSWPLSGIWAIGVLVGIHLLFSGWTILAVGLAARSVPE